MATEERARPLKFTYYSGMKGRKKVEVCVTRGSNIAEVLPNVSRFMTRKGWKYGAVVGEVIDEANNNQLLLVATYWPGEKFSVMFEQDVTRPICLTDFGEVLDAMHATA